MPTKSGRLTSQERRFARDMAITGDGARAAAAAGYAQPSRDAGRNMAKPLVAAEVARIAEETLFTDILPLALAAHKQLLTDPATPAGARVQAVKLAYDRTLGLSVDLAGKEPHEMTAEEIARAIGQLEAVAAARAKPVDQAEAGSSVDILA